jgi:two-component system osmolarity sensor histidine kinase EnvZ
VKRQYNSFYFRTAALLFIGALVSTAALLVVSWLLVGKPMVQHSAMVFARQIQNAAHTYPLVRPSERAYFRQRLFLDHALTLEPNGGAPLTGERARLPYFVMLETALSQLAGKPVKLLRQGDRYAVDFPGSPAPLRFHFSHDRIGTAPTLAIAVMAILALLSSLLAALLLAWYTARPIEDIAQRIDTQGGGAMRAPLPEEGPQELRHIARNFNQVTSQNRELLDSRAIMLAGISHDLRAPITRARMALELARADMDESLAQRIERALLQMETLIVQYLDFTGGSIKEGASPLNIPALLKEVAHAHKQHDIRFDISESVVYLPSRAFIRCAQNLLDNAVKHGAGAPIDVSFHKNASTWTLEISDRGPGIPDDQMRQVFQPFLRLDNARTQAGSGLGLTIVQEISRVQGWFVTLLPRPNGGLIARLSLPIAAQD